jgi:hypothetical protein
MRNVILLIGLALLTTSAFSQEPPKKGQNYSLTRIDLNGDGSLEKVGLHCTEVTDQGWYSRLTVWSGDGRQLWQSLPAKVGVWAFGGWDWGISDLQWVGDIDGDGAVEALAAEPVSDVSPVPFRIFRWSGRAFHHLKTASLLQAGPDRFVWSNERVGTTWIGAFKQGGLGVVWSMTGSGEVKLREARLQGEPQGFRVVKWLKP